MPATIQDNSKEWFAEFDRRCNEALEQIGDAILEQGVSETPIKTGATLRSEDKNVYPEEKRVEVGAGTDYAPAIMTGANRASGEPNSFLIRMLIKSKSRIKSILSGNMLDNKGITMKPSDLRR